MHADILNNQDHFNQLKMSRYTMLYENLPTDLFMQFVKEHFLDYSKCQNVKQSDENDKNQSILEIEVNVKNQN